jgi:anti-sigma factor RsiW
MTAKNHDHTRCLSLFEKMSEYIDNELDEQTRLEIEDHLLHCTQCRICFETLKRTIDICRHVKSKPIPVTLSTRLESLLKSMTDPTGATPPL